MSRRLLAFGGCALVVQLLRHGGDASEHLVAGLADSRLEVASTVMRGELLADRGVGGDQPRALREMPVNTDETDRLRDFVQLVGHHAAPVRDSRASPVRVGASEVFERTRRSLEAAVDLKIRRVLTLKLTYPYRRERSLRHFDFFTSSLRRLLGGVGGSLRRFSCDLRRDCGCLRVLRASPSEDARAESDAERKGAGDDLSDLKPLRQVEASDQVRQRTGYFAA